MSAAKNGRILIVDDEANMRRVLVALLQREGYTTFEAADGELALQALAEHDVDTVLTDLKMPHRNGLELLEVALERHPGLPVILLTAHGTVGSAVEALKRGAFDYLTKPFDPEEIKQVVAKAVATHALQEKETAFRPELVPDELLLGTSEALAEVKRVVARVAPTTATVLITGESGTGKELVARSLHLQSDREDAPFVKINCAAIPEPLLESELFGHEKGAFTGASRRKPGRFELADGGTLFLDEIGEMPLSAQPKLLRALQEGRFYRVGGTETVEVDVRLIAATNRELAGEVEAGRFREDLFYRLNVVPIRIPALRERPADIPALAAAFVRRFAERHGRPTTGLGREALDRLAQHRWPGNIRELENALERAVLLCNGDELTPDDLPAELLRPSGSTDGTGPCTSGNFKERIRTATRQLEREAILEALESTGGNVTKAAQALGLSRRGLQLKMKELGLK